MGVEIMPAAKKAAGQSADEMEIVSKVSIKTCGADPKEAVRQGKAVPLVRFWGYAEAIKHVINRATGDTNIALLGTFRAMNLATGQVYNSGVMYLPAGIHDMLSAPLLRSQGKEGAITDPIKFGIEVSSVPANNPVGYTYSGKMIIKPEGEDPLSLMEEDNDLRLLSASKK